MPHCPLQDCCFDPAFMADAQAMITSMVNTVYALAKGFNKVGSTGCHNGPPSKLAIAWVTALCCPCPCSVPAWVRQCRLPTRACISAVAPPLLPTTGRQQSADCLVTETWTTELALAHCLLTPADQAALRQAVITHNSSLCPAFYRDAYLKVRGCHQEARASCGLAGPNWQQQHLTCVLSTLHRECRRP